MKILARILVTLAGLAGVESQAVYVSPTGFGQALIYPYYTVRAADGNEFNTYLSIVNGDAQGKALRVRFREGRNGREVAGFNLFLEPYALWTAAVVPAGPAARVITNDPACVSPAFTVQSGSPPFLNFSDGAFTGAANDGFGTASDRVREGYVEVLEMASFPAGAIPSCASLRNEQVGALQAPRGYLAGTLTLINVASGMDFTVNADALANLATAAYYRPPADAYPDFNATEIGAVASFLLDNQFYRVSMPTGLAAVEASLVRRFVTNEIVFDAATASTTDWIVTMPTRRFHAGGTSSPWFTAAIASDGTLSWQGTYRGRNGPTQDLVGVCGFICGPNMREITIRTPYAATVLGFRSSTSALVNGAAGTTASLGSTNGWLVPIQDTSAGGALQLEPWNQGIGNPFVVRDIVATRVTDGQVTTGSRRIFGVPMVGFMVRTLKNGTLTCGGTSCQGNYGGSTPHRFRRDVVAP